LVPAARCGGPA